MLLPFDEKAVRSENLTARFSLERIVSKLRIPLFLSLQRHLPIILSLLFLSNAAFAQIDDSLYYTNPNYHVAKELFNRKIVMLGDYGHNQPAPLHRLLNTLYDWLDISANKEESHNLTLVLESDTLRCANINGYIKNGNIRTVTDKMKSEFYLENLEFYANLKSFSEKIDSVNQFRKNKIFFEVRGFEQIGDHNIEYVSRKSQKEDELWFVNERDSAIAAGIVNYLKLNPTEQILIFYGEAHLHSALIDKRAFGMSSLDYKEGFGFFLAHFLKQEFGNHDVLTVATLNFMPKPPRITFLDTASYDDILFKSKLMTSYDIMLGDYDYLISTEDKYINPADAGFVCSNYIFDKMVKNVYANKTYLPGYIAKRYYYWNLGGLYYLTGTQFRNDTELTNWLNEYKFDGSDWLYSDKLADFLTHLFVMERNKNYMNYIIRSYGIAYTLTDSDLASFEKWKENELPDILKHIKFKNSIGIYWFGYPDEKIKAKEYLKEFSGEDFAEPEKYLQWYRKKFWGFEY